MYLVGEMWNSEGGFWIGWWVRVDGWGVGLGGIVGIFCWIIVWCVFGGFLLEIGGWFG